MLKEPVYYYARDNIIESANILVAKLAPFCEPGRIMLVGSLRRGCPLVHDIDIVLSPLPGNLQLSMDVSAAIGECWQWVKGKSKLVTGRYCGIPVDLYFATEQQWWTLVVIRTGSKEHNIKLCLQAHRHGVRLHADGSGIQDQRGEYYTPKSEEDLFAVLDLPYVEPKDR